MPDLHLANETNDDRVIQRARERMTGHQHWIYEHMDPEVRSVAAYWYPGAHVLTRDLAEQSRLPHRVPAAMGARLSPGWDWNHNAEMVPRIIRLHQAGGITPETPTGMASKPMLGFAQRLADAQTKPGLQRMYAGTMEELRKLPYEAFSNDAAGDFARALWIISHDTARSQADPRNALVPMLHPYGKPIGWALKPNKQGLDTLKWQSTDNVGLALSILRNPSLANISEVLGEEGHKIRTFYNNTIAPYLLHGLVTGDTHHIGASHLLPIGISHAYAERGAGAPKNGATGSNGLYALYQEATRELARQLYSQTGYYPNQLQSIIWEGGRGLFPAHMKRSQKFVDDIETLMRNTRNVGSARDAIGRYILGRHLPTIPAPDWHLAGLSRYG